MQVSIQNLIPQVSLKYGVDLYYAVRQTYIKTAIYSIIRAYLCVL